MHAPVFCRLERLPLPHDARAPRPVVLQRKGSPRRPTARRPRAHRSFALELLEHAVPASAGDPDRRRRGSSRTSARRAGSSPGFTACRFAKLRSIRPPGREQHEGERDLSDHQPAADRTLCRGRRESRERPPAARRRSTFVRASGRSPNTGPRPLRAPVANATDVPSRLTVARRGMSVGAIGEDGAQSDLRDDQAGGARSQSEHHALGQEMHAPSARDRRRAPCESPTHGAAVSMRTRKRLATFAHAMHSTSATDPNSSQSALGELRAQHFVAQRRARRRGN